MKSATLICPYTSHGIKSVAPMCGITQGISNFVNRKFNCVIIVSFYFRFNGVINYLKNLVQLIFSPTRGWEDLETDEKREFLAYRNSRLEHYGGTEGASFHNETRQWEERESARQFRFGFLPCIAVCACSSFVKMLYNGGPGFLGALQMAIITFVSLFLATQSARYAFSVYMPRLCGKTGLDDGGYSKGRSMLMIMYCLTFLGLITLVANIVKVRIALIEFLPLYVVFIIWKGWKFVGVEERNLGLFMIMATVSILGSAYLVSFLLNAII